MESEIFIIFLVMVVLIVMNNYLPIKGRKGILFGCIVEEEQKLEEPFKGIISKYKKINITTGIIFLIIIILGGILKFELLLPVGILLYVGVNFVISAKMHKFVLEGKKTNIVYKKPKTVAALEKTKLTVSRIIYYIGIAFIFLFINGYEIITRYNDLPEKIPTHFTLSGVANGWTDKGSGGVLLMIAGIVVLVIIYIGGDILTYKSTLKIDPKNKEGSYKANIKTKKYLSIMLALTMLPVLVVFTVTNFVTLGIIDGRILKYIMIIESLTMVGVIGFCIVIVREKNNYEVKDKNVTFKDDDKYWKFGMIYYNKDNPKIFVEKRSGLGFTVNAGRMGGMIFYIILVILLLSVILLPLFGMIT
ncbi:MAG: DUF1648 domain-containing protein [Clostridium sp.]